MQVSCVTAVTRFSFQGKPENTYYREGLWPSYGTPKPLKWYPASLNLTTFEFMSVNISGTSLDNFRFLPQLNFAWLPGSFLKYQILKPP